MPAAYRGSQEFTVPAEAGQLAPEVLTLARGTSTDAADAIYGVQTLLTTDLPSKASVELWLLRVGGSSRKNSDFAFSGLATSARSGAWGLCAWDGAQIRVRSGGAPGIVAVSATAD